MSSMFLQKHSRASGSGASWDVCVCVCLKLVCVCFAGCSTTSVSPPQSQWILVLSNGHALHPPLLLPPRQQVWGWSAAEHPARAATLARHPPAAAARPNVRASASVEGRKHQLTSKHANPKHIVHVLHSLLPETEKHWVCTELHSSACWMKKQTEEMWFHG